MSKKWHEKGKGEKALSIIGYILVVCFLLGIGWGLNSWTGEKKTKIVSNTPAKASDASKTSESAKIPVNVSVVSAPTNQATTQALAPAVAKVPDAPKAIEAAKVESAKTAEESKSAASISETKEANSKVIAELEVLRKEVKKLQEMSAPEMKSENYGMTGSIVASGTAPAPAQASTSEATMTSNVIPATDTKAIGPCPKKGGPRFVDVAPRLDGNEVILSGTLPAGAVLLDVEIYDDVRGIPTRHLGAVSCFALERGAGFNFVWQDQEGHRHYQMINSGSSRLLVGTGLDVDCSNSGGCKYIRP